MNFCPDFTTISREERRVSLFQSNLRKLIRKLPKFLKSVKIIQILIQYFSILFNRVLRTDARGLRAAGSLGGRGAGQLHRWASPLLLSDFAAAVQSRPMLKCKRQFNIMSIECGLKTPWTVSLATFPQFCDVM